jgi:hypothetical protein
MQLLSFIIANKQEKGYWEDYSILGQNFRIEILPLRRCEKIENMDQPARTGGLEKI